MNHIMDTKDISLNSPEQDKILKQWQILFVTMNLSSLVIVAYTILDEYQRLTNLGIKFEVDNLLILGLFVCLPFSGILYFTEKIKGKIIEWILLLLYSIAGMIGLLLSMEGDPGSGMILFVVTTLFINAGYLLIKALKSLNFQKIHTTLSKNKFLIIGIVTLTALFAWFEIRPTMIKKDCAKSSKYGSYSSYNLNEEKYKNCLRVRGL